MRSSREILADLIAFDTTSRESNLALIEYVRAYLDGLGIASELLFNEDRSKANLYARLGPDGPGGVMLSGHSDVVPVDGQPWTVPPFTLTERDGTIWRGDWIAGFSWLRREGAFAAIPGGPIFDLSFSDVVPHHLLTNFRPWEFGNNVHAGMVCGWVHKPAAIVGEKRVGRGGVVATTFRLTREAPGADPVAAALFDALVATTRELPVDGE